MTGPDAATCIIVAPSLGPLAGGDPERYLALMVILTLITGVLYILAGLSRLGFIANFLSQPILTAYLNGIAPIIISGQLQKLFCYSGEAANFFPKLAEFASSIGDSHILALLLGLSLLALLVILRQFAPELPAALVVVIVGIVAVATVLPSLAVFRRACLRRTSPLSNQVYSNRFSLTLRVSPWSVSPAGY